MITIPDRKYILKGVEFVHGLITKISWKVFLEIFV